ncbi:rhomboid family intramembrane serine protease [Marinimicrobium alkaliphilum]|uniref:rhomboid family intramembrane serine protease n=1 Tax=Marinimicrobium alkaliphilum TaxID=2202654 RepID=UPI000DBA4478|nr:rhomboid family intramembrane serine protease [Marinimicrobium alkaliphilum]
MYLHQLSPKRTPVTLVLIALSLLGTLLTATNAGFQFLPWFTFQNFAWSPMGQPIFEPVAEGIGQGQVWRLLTPAFIHFGLLHIAFNALWLWELGRRIELLNGRVVYILFVITWAIGSNLVQYFWQGESLFGGMSGVVYALVGYIWMRHRMNPHPLLAVPPGIIGFMMVWLVLGLTGVIDMFMGSGGVANGAHVGGLLVGMLWGIIFNGRRP